MKKQSIALMMVLMTFLIILSVGIAGCSSQAPSASSVTQPATTPTAAPTTSQPPSDRAIVQQGIADSEKICIDNLPRDVPTDKCVLTSETKEKMTNLIVQNITEAEQHCQTVLPRSKDLSLCKISDSKKVLITRFTALCMQGNEPTISKMTYCLYVQTYRRPWYDDYYLN